MKIAYTNAGVLQGVALDTEQLSGDNVATVADNIAVFGNLCKWRYINSEFVLAPYMVMVPAKTIAAIDEQVSVVVTAYNSNGTVATGATDSFSIGHQDGAIAPDPVVLVAGVAEFS